MEGRGGEERQYDKTQSNPRHTSVRATLCPLDHWAGPAVKEEDAEVGSDRQEALRKRKLVVGEQRMQRTRGIDGGRWLAFQFYNRQHGSRRSTRTVSFDWLLLLNTSSVILHFHFHCVPKDFVLWLLSRPGKDELATSAQRELHLVEGKK